MTPVERKRPTAKAARRSGLGPPYPVPPIIDAIIELRLQEPMRESAFSRIARKLASQYEKHATEEATEVQIKVDGTNIDAQEVNRKTVHSFTSDDEASRCRIDRSTLHWSRLPPYESWEKFEERMLQNFELIVTHLRAFPRLARVGVRFRNRIDVPAVKTVEASDVNFFCQYEDYLTINLTLPPELDPVQGYQWTIERQLPEQGLTVKVMSGPVRPELPDTGAFLLDIDVSKSVDFPSGIRDFRSLLGQMRQTKNNVFELSITDKARESFR